MGRPLTDPIIEYGHDQGASVIGGYVYRGQALPELMGNYIFADWSNNFEKGNDKLFIATPSEDDKLWPIKEIEVANRPYGQVDAFMRAFGQDENGELYALTSDSIGLKGDSGKIYKLTPAH